MSIGAIQVYIGHDNTSEFLLKAGAPGSVVAVTIGSLTKIGIEIDRYGVEKNVDSVTDSTLFTLTGLDPGVFQVQLGSKFEDTDAGTEWQGRLVLFDATNTNGVRQDEPFRIQVKK